MQNIPYLDNQAVWIEMSNFAQHLCIYEKAFNTLIMSQMSQISWSIGTEIDSCKNSLILKTEFYHNG